MTLVYLLMALCLLLTERDRGEGKARNGLSQEAIRQSPATGVYTGGCRAWFVTVGQQAGHA
jgi:hypothetical protein